MVATSKTGTSNVARGHEASQPLPPSGFAPEGLDGFELPSVEEQVTECQSMNLVTLRTAFAAFRGEGVSKRLARGASTIYRGVSGQMRSLEFGQRE